MKRLLALALATVLFVTALPLQALALEAQQTAAEEKNAEDFLIDESGLEYRVTEGGSVEICGYRGTEIHLMIPSEIDGMAVTHLAEEAFAYHETLKSVLIPASVTSIGNSAFYHCASLDLIAMEKMPADIGFTLVEGDVALRTLIMVMGENFGDEAFSNLQAFLKVIVFDLGENPNVEPVLLDTADEVRAAYLEYINFPIWENDRTTITLSDEIVAEGTCGESMEWKLDANGVLGILGTGEMLDFGGAGAPWAAYAESILALSVEDGITSIGNHAFFNCRYLQAVMLPDGLKRIGMSAFGYCDRINSLNSYRRKSLFSLQSAYRYTLSNVSEEDAMATDAYDDSSWKEGTGKLDGFSTGELWAALMNPDSRLLVRAHFYIDDLSQYEGAELILNTWVDDGLKVYLNGNLVYGEGQESAGDSTTVWGDSCEEHLRKGDNLVALSVHPSEVERLLDASFKLVIPASGLPVTLTEIGDYAFSDCRRLCGDLRIPSSVARVGCAAFRNCLGITGTLTIEENDGMIIEDDAFCSVGASALVVGEGVSSIGSNAFAQWEDVEGDLVIPDSVTSIASNAFSNSEFSGALMLPNGLTRIGAGAFASCRFSGTLVIPDSVEEIASAAFEYLEGVHAVVLSSGLSLAEAPFFGSEDIKTVTFRSASVPGGAPLLEMPSLETVFVPTESYDAYVEAYASDVSESVCFATDPMDVTVRGLSAQSSSGTVLLTWNAHSNADVVGYRILRDGVVIADTAQLYFIDREVALGETYEYTVCGYDSLGNTTAATCVEETTTLPTVTGIRTENAKNKVGVKNGTVLVSVDIADGYLFSLDGASAKGCLYYSVGETRVPIGEAIAPNANGEYYFDWDISDVADGDTAVIFAFEDVNGMTVEYTAILTVDHSVPARIESVLALGDVRAIHVNWAIAAEIDTTYLLFRRADNETYFSRLARIDDRDTHSYTDTDVERERVYSYYVVAVNDFGQEAEPSFVSFASLIPDAEAPIVLGITPESGKYLCGTVTLGMRAQDNVAVTRTELFYSVDDGATWVRLAQSEGDSLTATLDTKALSDGSLRLKGVAWDADGNESVPMVSVYRIDNTGPEQVRGLGYESTSVTATLVWYDVADNDIAYFRVEMKNPDGSYRRVADIRDTLGANIYHLTPDTAYTYRVVGYDVHGNRGAESEEITVRTARDTTAPVITRIRPTSGYYSDVIALTLTATDEYCIESILLQTSQDGVTWTDVETKRYDGAAATRTWSYTLSLDGFEEGYLYVRAIATDAAGNQSASDALAPFVQHIVDRAAPKQPENVSAVGYSGYIEIAWTQGSETDLGTYSVYRATEENGSYRLIKSGIAALNYFDRDVTPGMTYFYKVCVNDLAENESVFSAAVQASVLLDTELPKIHAITPSESQRIGVSNHTFGIIVSDNNVLASILVEYSKNAKDYSTVQVFTELPGDGNPVFVTPDIRDFAHGETLSVRVTATDGAGNRAVRCASYTVDLAAPEIVSPEAALFDGAVCLAWNSGAEEDLAGYRIYRAEKGSDAYRLIAQRHAVAEQSRYLFNDSTVEQRAVTYVYRIEAVDKWGNTLAEELEIALPDRNAPAAVISCESVQEVGVEYYADASSSTDDSAIVSYLIDFGDGTSSRERCAVHKYVAIGTYTVTLTVTDDSGNVSVTTREITVKERSLLGSVKILVVDDMGRAVPNASVYFDLGEASQVVKTTDLSGYASFTAEVGRHAVGVIIPNNEWLPAKKEIVVRAGAETAVTVTMVRHTLVEGSFEITRMSFEEIDAAGIDVEAPENRYFVQVMIHLQYRNTTVSKPVYWNPVTKEQKRDPIYIGDYEYVPFVVPSGDGYEFSEDVSVILFELPTKISSLKEFFDVRLHIINNASSDFSMLDNVINLNVPEGLTLMKTAASEGDAMVRIDEIKGGVTKTVNWILRGDRIGEYQITADYSGILSQFNTPIYTRFESTDPLKVYGLSNLKLYVEAADMLDHATLYYNVALINEGDVDVYLPTVDTGDTLIEIELLDERGRDWLLRSGLTVKDLDTELEDGQAVEEWVTTLAGDVGVLKPGYALRKHYMCVDQSIYSEADYALEKGWYEIQNSYGLELEIVKRPLAYFKNYLNAGVNAEEKATLTLGANRGLYDYLMNDENFMYWRFYKTQGELMPSESDTDIWNLLKLDFAELMDFNDDERIQAILLDTMELSAQSNDYSDYMKSVKFLEELMNFMDDTDLDEVLEDGWAEVGKHFRKVIKEVFKYFRWEFHCSLRIYGNGNNFLYKQWEWHVEYERWSYKLSEAQFSKFRRALFSAKGFEVVWEGIGIAAGTSKAIVNAYKQMELDASIFILAQANIENHLLFLDSLLTYLPRYEELDGSFIFDRAPVNFYFNPAYTISAIVDYMKNDCNQLISCVKEVKAAMTENDPIGNFLKRLAENEVQYLAGWAVGKGIDAVLDAAKLSGSALVFSVKASLKLVTYIGDNVFHISQRNQIADNIRYLSLMSLAMGDAISGKCGASAGDFMQLLYYLLNMRMIGESQVAQLGVTYDVLPGEGEGAWNSHELFETVCKLSGVRGVNSWYEWRDVVEDKLSLARAELFKNPVTTDLSSPLSPTVTFDYAMGQTVQSFDETYEYSVDGGETWQKCKGEAIRPDPSAAITDLQVRSADGEGDWKKTGYCTVYGAPSLDSSGIVAVQNAFGYLIDHLDPDKTYEISFSHTPIDYTHGESLSMQIPAGSDSFFYRTGEAYEYVYIRSLADVNAYASHTMTASTVLHQSDWAVDLDAGMLTELAEGTAAAELEAYCEKLGIKAEVTRPDGTGTDAVGTGCVLTVDGTEYEIVVPADVNGDATVDVFDLFSMLSHVNGEESLEGAYLKAGCVNGNEEIDVFDIFSTLSYINGGNLPQ